jgi:hypothetical protein
MGDGEAVEPVFISYRTEDAADVASALHRELEQRFGPQRVFIDHRSVPPATPWPDQLRRHVEGAAILLVLVGPNWLFARDEYGGRRLDDPDDWVRLEIETALNRGRVVLPLMMDDVPHLEEEAFRRIPLLATFARLEASQLRRKDWKADFEALVDFLATHGVPPSQAPNVMERAVCVLHQHSVTPNDREAQLRSFSDRLTKHPEEITQIRPYEKVVRESAEWSGGDGDYFGVSFGEFRTLWSDTGLYGIFESNLVRYRRAGGKIHRTIVIDKEFFEASMHFLIVRTGMREVALGIEPHIVHYPTLHAAMSSSVIKCDMADVVNNRIAYFTQLKDPPLIVRTSSKEFVDIAANLYRALSREAKPFTEWLKTCPNSFRDIASSVRQDVEKEAALIINYAQG